MTDYMAADTNLPPYYPYPHFLMDMKLFHTAALTYALLLDRAHLSQLNGWTDEAGRVYIVFPVDKIAAALNRSLSSAKNALELIPKLAMNLDKLTPDNNGASKMNQSEIVLSLLFKADK